MKKFYKVEILNHTVSEIDKVKYFTTKAKANAYIKKMNTLFDIMVYAITTIIADE